MTIFSLETNDSLNINRYFCNRKIFVLRGVWLLLITYTGQEVIYYWLRKTLTRGRGNLRPHVLQREISFRIFYVIVGMSVHLSVFLVVTLTFDGKTDWFQIFHRVIFLYILDWVRRYIEYNLLINLIPCDLSFGPWQLLKLQNGRKI